MHEPTSQGERVLVVNNITKIDQVIYLNYKKGADAVAFNLDCFVAVYDHMGGTYLRLTDVKEPLQLHYTAGEVIEVMTSAVSHAMMSKPEEA